MSTDTGAKVLNQDKLVVHYKARLRSLLPYAKHKDECAFIQWRIAEHLQKARGQNYSAGPMPACTCGFMALYYIILAEVYDEHGNPV